jgi:hypothetical protein
MIQLNQINSCRYSILYTYNEKSLNSPKIYYNFIKKKKTVLNIIPYADVLQGYNTLFISLDWLFVTKF